MAKIQHISGIVKRIVVRNYQWSSWGEYEGSDFQRKKMTIENHPQKSRAVIDYAYNWRITHNK